VTQGEADGKAFLVLEYLALGRGTDAAFRELGRRLARLHAHHGSEFGWHRDNFIGLTAQSNTPRAAWTGFWQTERLAPQLALAARNGHGGELQSLGKQLIDAVPDLLAGRAPAPSLLHGDLWDGNAGFVRDGTPVVFDPAVYYGDPEADLAMTELFGGFPQSFYDGYRELRATDQGYRQRRELYNLYHVLNHLNLFGKRICAGGADDGTAACREASNCQRGYRATLRFRPAAACRFRKAAYADSLIGHLPTIGVAGRRTEEAGCCRRACCGVRRLPKAASTPF
jgi:fructosamine-3-kinase